MKWPEDLTVEYLSKVENHGKASWVIVVIGGLMVGFAWYMDWLSN
jgi:hypothetical protein